MYVEKIEWLDKEGQEAILKVADGMESLLCFSCPCSYRIGDVLSKPLECLDADDIVLCDTNENGIEQIEGSFKCKLKGKLKDIQNGIVEVYGFHLHIDEEKIPGDMVNGMYVQFVSFRIDVW